MESLETPQASPEPRAAPLKPQQKGLLLAGGFFGWYLINGLFWLSIWLFSGNPISRGDSILLNLLILPANGLALLILGILPRTRMIALGVLAALALNYAISMVLGLTMNAICFIPFLFKTQ